MSHFIERIRSLSKEKKSRIILALDLIDQDPKVLEDKAIRILEETSEQLVGMKLNYHILLPLDLYGGVRRILDKALSLDLMTIADLKLNDIASTNSVASRHLWSVGFDALIANPFVGYEDGLGPVFQDAHERGRGVILLVYMSHEGSKEGFGLTVVSRNRRRKFYQLFLHRALEWGADGVIVAATTPAIIREASSKLRGRIPIFSPGVGAQGGSIERAVKAGSEFIIVGRAIVESINPRGSAESIRRAAWPS
ncbi:MAG: orotidine 5'-phosphate decarboxylase / HUMPS family protein [Nitrososphaerota archaeon]